VEVTYEGTSILKVEQQFCRLLFAWLRSWEPNRVFCSLGRFILPIIFFFLEDMECSA
jgi:hypothetical protein